jgi:hypothetical protein
MLLETHLDCCDKKTLAVIFALIPFPLPQDSSLRVNCNKLACSFSNRGIREEDRGT